MELKYTYLTSIPYYKHTISRIKANLICIEVQCMYTKFIYNKTNHKFCQFVAFFFSSSFLPICRICSLNKLVLHG